MIEIIQRRLALTEMGLLLAFGRTRTTSEIRVMARSIVRRGACLRRQWFLNQRAPLPKSEKRLLRLVEPESRKGAVVCTFHTGRHFRIPRSLTCLGASVCLVMDAHNYDRSTTFRFRPASGNEPVRERYAAINTESRLAGFQILKHLEGGDLVFVYADGNSGGSPSSPNDLTLKLFDLPVRPRFRIPEIAHMAGTPLHVVLDVKQPSGRYSLEHSALFEPASGFSRKEFSHAVSREMFVHLQKILDEMPDAWEEWHQLPWWVDFDAMLSEPAKRPSRMRVVKRMPKSINAGFTLNVGAITIVADRDTGTIYLSRM